MRALGVPGVRFEATNVDLYDYLLSQLGYPPVEVQEAISRKIIAAEARRPVTGPELKCARPSCRNKFVPRRRDQRTCGTARCRQWWSRQQRTRNVTVARRRGGGSGDTGNREYGPVNTGPAPANCDTPALPGAGVGGE
jgi:hypothetical protein